MIKQTPILVFFPRLTNTRFAQVRMKMNSPRMLRELARNANLCILLLEYFGRSKELVKILICCKNLLEALGVQRVRLFKTSQYSVLVV